MAPATELATIPLTSGAEIEDPASSAGKVWQSSLDTVAQQDGFQRAYWGREVENPSVVMVLFVLFARRTGGGKSHPHSVLQLFVDWDSLDHHKRFIAAPIYGAFSKHLLSIVDGTIEMRHASLTPHPPTAALGTASPVTEVLTCYFGEKGDEGFESKYKQAIKMASENAEGFKGAVGGWVVEDVEYEGKKGKAFVGLLGWESVEAHMAYRETQAFKDNIHLLTEDSLGLDVHHTKFVER